MIDTLITGTLAFQPEERQGRNGTYTVARLRVGQHGAAAVFCSVMAFDAEVQRVLLALDKGDAVALAGALEVTVYTPDHGEPRPNLNLVAHHATTPYHIRRKRLAVAGDDNESNEE